MIIASNTSCSNDSNPLDFAAISLTPEIAAQLLTYKTVYAQALAHDTSLYAIEFFNYTAEFGKSEYDIGDEWVEVPDDAVTKERSDVHTMKITSTGIIWTACPKNADTSSETVESEELRWTDIERVSRGENPFKTVPPLDSLTSDD